MYDRYKSRRKNTGIYKFFGILLISVAVIFLALKYRHYLEFWKYNRNKLEQNIESIGRIKQIEKKRESLADLADVYARYKAEHPTDADAFFVSGKIHYLLAETYLPGNFSELFINDRVRDISKDAKLTFLKSIRDFKKGCALDTGGLDDSYRFMLALACFYTDYYSIPEIYSMIDAAGDMKQQKNLQYMRFYSILNIMNKQEDRGLQLLSASGMVKDNIQGLLFYATAERLAKKYTGAIVTYKNVLTLTNDDKVRKLVYINLGKVYFNQSLYRESLEQFNLALKIDDKDSMPKIWIGKNYSAMGEKDKAKAIWSEIMTTEGTNAEVKELMKTM